MDDAQAEVYAFAGYRLDTRRRELLGPDGTIRPLTSRAMDVLVHLVAHRERIVAKDELLRTVWAGRVVEENNLTQAVSAIRRAFGTGAGDHRIVLTVPGRGYRFVATAEPLGVERRRPVVSPVTRADAPRPSRRPLLAFALAVTLAGLAPGATPIARLLPAPVAATTVGVAAGGGCNADQATRRDLLVARHALQRYGADRAAPAHDAIRRVLAADPACADGYAVLAQLYLADVLHADGDPRLLMPRATHAGRRATELEPDGALVLVARGRLAIWRDRDGVAADQAFSRALACDAKATDALLGRALALHLLDRGAEGEALTARAAELDPLSPTATVAAANWSADPQARNAHAAGAAVVEPGYWLLALQQGALLEADGDPAAAAAHFRRAVRQSGRNSRSLVALARAHAASGERAAVLAIVEELESRARARYVPPTMRAAALASAGQAAQAISLLEQAEAIGDPLLLMARQHASLDVLQGEPRFDALLVRLNAPRPGTAASPAELPAMRPSCQRS